MAQDQEALVLVLEAMELDLEAMEAEVSVVVLALEAQEHWELVLVQEV